MNTISIKLLSSILLLSLSVNAEVPTRQPTPSPTSFPVYIPELLTCPPGSQQIGSINADISGCGLDECDQRYNKNSITECYLHCLSHGECESFTWAPLGGDRNHLEETVCTIYDSKIQTGEWSPNQILCVPYEAICISNGELGYDILNGEYIAVAFGNYMDGLYSDVDSCEDPVACIYKMSLCNGNNYYLGYYAERFIITTIPPPPEEFASWSDTQKEDYMVGGTIFECHPGDLADCHWTREWGAWGEGFESFVFTVGPC